MTDISNLRKGTEPTFLGAFNAGHPIAYWQIANFDPEDGVFNGPDIVAFNSISQARKWFRELMNVNPSLGSEINMFLYQARIESPYSIDPDDESIRLFEIGPNGGLKERGQSLEDQANLCSSHKSWQYAERQSAVDCQSTSS